MKLTSPHRHETAAWPAFRRPAWMVAGLLTLGLGGCSSVPDAVNPVEWYRGAERAIFGPDTVAEASGEPAADMYIPPEAIPGEDRPFPNLADVPDRPPARTPQDTAALARGLIADREHARHGDLALAPAGVGGAAPPGIAVPPGAEGAIAGADSNGRVDRGTLPAVEPQRIMLGTPATPEQLAAREAERRAAAERQAREQELAQQREAARRAAATPAFSDAPPPSFSDAPPAPREPRAEPPPRSQFANVPPPTFDGPPPPPRSEAAAPPPPPPPSLGGPPDAAGAGTPPPDAVAQLQVPSAGAAAAPPARAAERVAVIRFSGDSAALDDVESQVLERIATLHAEHGGTIRVVGHASHGAAADPDQRQALDRELSRKRALVVAEALVRLGVPEDSVRLRGDGGGGAGGGAQRAEIFFVH